MISLNETPHCRKILSLLDKESLFSIKDTLTKGVIVVADEQGTCADLGLPIFLKQWLFRR